MRVRTTREAIGTMLMEPSVSRTASFDDVVVHFPGKSSLAGEYKGKDQLLEMFGRWQERTPEFTFDPHAYLADDEHGVCLQFSHYKRGNEQLDSNDVIVYHFRNGKISEVWLLSYDEDAVDAFLG